MTLYRAILAELSPEAIRVLICVCIEANCSQARVSRITGLSINGVKASLQELQARGLIIIEHNGGRRPGKYIRVVQPAMLDDILPS